MYSQKTNKQTNRDNLKKIVILPSMEGVRKDVPTFSALQSLALGDHLVEISKLLQNVSEWSLQYPVLLRAVLLKQGNKARSHVSRYAVGWLLCWKAQTGWLHVQPCSLKQTARACHLAFGWKKGSDSPIWTIYKSSWSSLDCLLKDLSSREQVSYPSHNTSLGYNMAFAICIN